MLDSIRRIDPTQPLARVLFFRFWYWVVMILYVVVYRVRLLNTGAVPDTGGVLIVANHESHLDPPLIGIGVRRRNIVPVARQGLFRAPGLGLLLRGLGCIALREDEGDAGAIKKAIAALKAGRVVVLFPEGSRTPDGELKEFKRGLWILLARSGVPVLPAAVAGCFEAWPRTRALPRLFGQRVAVLYGNVIPFAELKALGPDVGLKRLRDEIEALRASAHEVAGRSLR